MGSMAICLFIFFKGVKKNLPISVSIWEAWASVSELIFMKNNVVYGYTFIYNGNMGSGLFYNMPYFRLRLTAFYDQPAVHLHVSGRQEHCIIMSFPAPKCYFTGRGSFLKLHHFYNFLNFYSRHYYQQDFITYLECKQVWVMTPPPRRLPEIILCWWSRSYLCVHADAKVQIHAHTGTHTKLLQSSHACVRSHKLSHTAKSQSFTITRACMRFW